MNIDLDLVNNLLRELDKMDRKNEENVKVLIVIEMLKILGYEASSFDLEHPVYHNEKRADIAIKIDRNEYFYVETKRGDQPLTEGDIIQLAIYLGIKNIEWGLLTNGYEYLLLNNKIEPVKKTESALKDKVVFHFGIKNKKDLKYFYLLSKDSLFDSKITHYFKDIAQYKAYKFYEENRSWDQYKGTLYNFFIYYANKEKKYRPLNEIRIDDFEEFLRNDQLHKESTSKRVRSMDTFNAKYSHIRSMLSELKKNGKIATHHFEQEKRLLIESLNYVDINKDYSIINLDNIEKILRFLDTVENPTRDKTLFLLCLYIGLERSKIGSLEWGMFDFEKSIMMFEGRKIPIPNKLQALLMELKRENKEKGIKGNNLFYTYYRQRFNLMTEASINEVYNRLQKIDSSDEKWAQFSPQFIRNGLIYKLFESNFSIDEIVYLTGMDLINIANLLSFEAICKRASSGKNQAKNKHPFEGVLI